MLTIMRTLFVVLLCYFITNPVFSQDDFYPLKSKGKIPQEFLTLSKEKYLKDKATISSDDKYNVRQSKEEFYLFTNYKIDYLLRSGRVLFGDDVTEYVNEVGQYILKDDPELKDKIRFYVTKSPEVNAFSTYQGIVFVNLGLIAQVENEAELAYVLAHEIIHYKNHHVINDYLNTQNIINGKGEYGKYSYDQKVHAYFNYSKDNEMEADEQGLKNYYLKTDYDINQVLNVFDVLLYSYLPCDEIPFDTTFFDDRYFRVPSDFYLKEVKHISAVEDYDDSESTHPNIKSRRSNIYDIIGNLDDVKEGKKYIISEDKFKKAQKDARFEMSQLYISDLEYGKSFYNTYLLLSKYPNSIYLKKKMGYVLYGLSKYANYHYLGDVLSSESKIEGESQQVYHLLRKFKDDQLTAIAIKYLWKSYNETKDEYFKNLATELMYDFFIYSSKTPGYFLKDYVEETDTTQPFVELSQEEYLKLSKYEKIKYDKKKILYEKKPESKNFLEYVFVTQFKDEAFGKALNDAQAKAKEDDEKTDPHKKKKKITRLGIDSITIVNPGYLVVNNKNNTDYITTEDHDLAFIDLLRLNAQRTGLNTNVLTVPEFTENDIDKFNDLSALNSWLSEFIMDQDYDKFWDIQNSQQEYIMPLIKKYKMKYFGITGVRREIASRDQSQILGAVYLCLLVVPIPYSMYIFFTKEKWTSYFFYLFDLEKGKVMFTNTNVLKTSDYQYVLNSNIYDTFNQITKKPKK